MHSSMAECFWKQSLALELYKQKLVTYNFKFLISFKSISNSFTEDLVYYTNKEVLSNEATKFNNLYRKICKQLKLLFFRKCSYLLLSWTLSTLPQWSFKEWNLWSQTRSQMLRRCWRGLRSQYWPLCPWKDLWLYASRWNWNATM